MSLKPLLSFKSLRLTLFPTISSLSSMSLYCSLSGIFCMRHWKTLKKWPLPLNPSLVFSPVASLLAHYLYFQNGPCVLLASITDSVELLQHCLLHDSCGGSAFSVCISMLIEQHSTWQSLDSSCPLQVLKPSRKCCALRKYRKLSSSCQTDPASCLCWAYDNLQKCLSIHCVLDTHVNVPLYMAGTQSCAQRNPGNARPTIGCIRQGGRSSLEKAAMMSHDPAH